MTEHKESHGMPLPLVNADKCPRWMPPEQLLGVADALNGPAYYAQWPTKLAKKEIESISYFRHAVDEEMAVFFPYQGPDPNIAGRLLPKPPALFRVTWSKSHGRQLDEIKLKRNENQFGEESSEITRRKNDDADLFYPVVGTTKNPVANLFHPTLLWWESALMMRIIVDSLSAAAAASAVAEGGYGLGVNDDYLPLNWKSGLALVDEPGITAGSFLQH